jgi:small-conductance mechanosensitive channel
MSPSFSARLLRRAALLLALAGLTLAAPPGRAQTTAPAPAPSTTAPAPAPSAAQRAKLDAIRLQLDQIEAGLDRLSESDAALQQIRQQVEPLAGTVRDVVADVSPRAEAARQRLKELGPKPDDKSPPESPDVARERDERQASVTDYEETIRIGRALLVQADQIQQETQDRRRQLFAKRIFESSVSFLSPQLWLGVWRTLPQELNALSLLGQDLNNRAASRLSPGTGSILLLVALLAIFLNLPMRRHALLLAKRDRLGGEPNHLQRAIGAVFVALGGTVGPLIAAFILYQLVVTLDLLPPRLVPVFGSIMKGAVFIAFVRSLYDGLLAPDRAGWRLFRLTDDRVDRLILLATVTAALLVAGTVLEALFRSIAAGLPLSLAIKGLFALAIAVTVARALRLVRLVDPCDEAVFGPHVSTSPDYTGLVRMLGWALVGVVVGALVTGYVAFAWFLAVQIVWASLIGSVLVLLLTLADEGVTTTFGSDGRTSRLVHASVGLSKRSLEQIGVLVSGALRLALIVVAAKLLLAPWGVESGDVTASLGALFFGITVGGVTLSLSTVFAAVAVFVLGIVVTRTVQRWLQNRYFPHTQMDAGLQNSITTGLGYLGVVLASAVSVSWLGLSLDKLTIVAGALSVGIGFGLQSIVNNFVSGLILLAERGIRVGDWVVVGGEQGYVRRINVRATQIETFDRATLIVPNSNLVSGVVKNWVHSDRTGRVIVTVPVPRDADADEVASILRNVAAEHPDVMEEPPPRVLFKTITESALTFDLIAFVGEIDTANRVSSDLTFVIFRRLRDQGVIKPGGPPKLEIEGLNRMRDELGAIRRRLGFDEDSVEAAPSDAPRPAGETA